MVYLIILHCIVLCRVALYCIVLDLTVLYSIVLWQGEKRHCKLRQGTILVWMVEWHSCSLRSHYNIVYPKWYQLYWTSTIQDNPIVKTNRVRGFVFFTLLRWGFTNNSRLQRMLSSADLVLEGCPNAAASIIWNGLLGFGLRVLPDSSPVVVPPLRRYVVHEFRASCLFSPMGGNPYVWLWIYATVQRKNYISYSAFFRYFNSATVRVWNPDSGYVHINYILVSLETKEALYK